ncbi:MAG TPA: phosphatase PAP2 family protein [Candidatus Polarisedimenticolaceae bacterium]|nr:phosphatase PAP2 family protein [Candidatus Polarisedimenticolaceae bacterium]
MHNALGLVIAKTRALPARNVLRILVPLVIIGLLAVHRTFLTPDILFFILFVIFLSYGLAIEFIRMFSPFVALLLSYDSLRSFVPYVTERVHFHEMIGFDQAVGGGSLPTVQLQQLLYHGHLVWYDFYFYGLYMLHFVIPVLLAVLIWRRRPQAYWQYAWSLVALSYAAFITYFLFPAAPPWMAADQHLIPHIQKISTDVWYAFGVESFPTIYAQLSPNLVAAVPSLHAAYPTLVMLFIGKLFGWRWGVVSLLYPLSVWVGIVYMGEHYVFDVIAGIVYAVTAFLVVPQLIRLWHTHRARPRRAKKPKAQGLKTS